MLRLISVSLIMFLIGCDNVGDGLRNWGSRHREKRTQEISATELEMWKRDLAISEAQAIKLQKQIGDLVSERKRQGELSWKIAKVMMQQMRFEDATDFVKAATIGEMPKEIDKNQGSLLEESLPFFQTALKHHIPDPDLLFDAGLCYANASHNLGWEEDRFKTAVFLLERGKSIKPEDGRFAYQLAVLYGKTTNRYKDANRAIQYLDELLKREDANIPARFALANILTETGDLQAAFDENAMITQKVEQLFKENRVKGNFRENIQYRNAQRNMEQLQLCIEGKPTCMLRDSK